MQPSEFEELDWDEAMDLAERVQERYGEDLEAVLEVFKQLLENNAIAVSNAVMQIVNATQR